MKNLRIDQMDRKILRVLQIDNSISVSEIGDRVGLSGSSIWKRIERLKREKIIKSECAIINHKILGFNLMAYVSIRIGKHSSSWLEEFSKKITAFPEVMEFHRMAGDIDYMLKVMVIDIQAFDLFYKDLIKISELAEVTSRFSMESIKETTQIPI